MPTREAIQRGQKRLRLRAEQLANSEKISRLRVRGQAIRAELKATSRRTSR